MTLLTRVLAAIVFATLTASAQVAPTPPVAPVAPEGRHPEAGGLLLRTYPPDVYKGFGQNWTLLQDKRGVIYVGSTNGILEYDGVTWRKILTPSRSTVRSLAAGSAGCRVAQRACYHRASMRIDNRLSSRVRAKRS